MSSTNKTSKGLSQFEGTDRLKRTDYNADMQIIDNELEQMLKKIGSDNLKINATGTKTIFLNHDTNIGDSSEIAFGCANRVGAKILSKRTNANYIGNEGNLEFYTQNGSSGTDVEIATMILDQNGNLDLPLGNMNIKNFKVLTEADKSTDTGLIDNSDSLIPSQKAVKTFVLAKIAELVDSSPDTLNTLNELAVALGDDPNFSTTITNLIATKLSKTGSDSLKINATGTKTIFLNHDTNIGDSSEIAFGCANRVGAKILSKRTNANNIGNEGNLEFYTQDGSSGTDVETPTMILDQNGNLNLPLGNMSIKNFKVLTEASLTGFVFWIAGATVPNGYLECNGSYISKTTYADLYAVIGDTFGSTTSDFKLPDLRGEFIRGWDNGRGIDSGRTFGSSQDDSFEFHNHDYTVVKNSGTSSEDNFYPIQGSPSNVGTATDSTNSTGGTETRPRNIALMPIIKY